MSERHESIVDQRIREAQEQGAFDNLAGSGKPLRGLHGPDDENWWLRSYMRREGLTGSALLPTSLQLRKEIEDLPETVRGMHSEDAVRRVVGELNARIVAWVRNPVGPRVAVRPVPVEEIVEEWRATLPTNRAPAAPPSVPRRSEQPARRRFAFWRRAR